MSGFNAWLPAEGLEPFYGLDRSKGIKREILGEWPTEEVETLEKIAEVLKELYPNAVKCDFIGTE